MLSIVFVKIYVGANKEEFDHKIKNNGFENYLNFHFIRTQHGISCYLAT